MTRVSLISKSSPTDPTSLETRPKLLMKKGFCLTTNSLGFTLKLCKRTFNCRKPNVRLFSKDIGRDDKFSQTNLTPSTFDGNTEFLMPKLSKQLIPFNKNLTRQPILNINKAVTNDSVIPDNIHKYHLRNSKFKKTPVPDFSKTIARNSSTESLLPSFMEVPYSLTSIGSSR